MPITSGSLRGASNAIGVEPREAVMKYEDIIFEKAAGVAKITINRPAAYNALRTHTRSQMCVALEDAE